MSIQIPPPHVTWCVGRPATSSRPTYCQPVAAMIVAGRTRVTLRLAARPISGVEDGSKEHSRVNLSGEGLVARFDPNRLRADGHHPAEVVGAGIV